MKFFLLLVVCLLGTSLATPFERKLKRDILPGDARYNNGYQYEIARAPGGYAGSYSVPENSYQRVHHIPAAKYGPPNYQPSRPIDSSYVTAAQNVQSFTRTPVNVYGPPENFRIPEQNVQPARNTYLAPTVEDVRKPVVSSASHRAPATTIKHVPVQTYGPPSVTQTVRVPQAQEHVEIEQTRSYEQPQFQQIQQINEVKQPVVASNVQPVFVENNYRQQPMSYQQLPSAAPAVGFTQNLPAEYGAPIRSYQSVSHTPQDQYRVEVTRNIPYTVSVPQVAQVQQQRVIRVQQPAQVAVAQPVQVTVPQPAPSHVHQPSPVAISQSAPVHFSQLPPVAVRQQSSVSVSQPIPVSIPQPIHTQTEIKTSQREAPRPQYGVPSVPSVGSDNESISIESVGAQSSLEHATVNAAREYTQPIAENGGYVY